MYRPAGYSSSENSDDDDIEAFGSKHVNVKTQSKNVEHTRDRLLSELLNCVQHGYVDETVALITDNHLSVDVHVHQDWTPLMLAVSNGHFDLTQKLIKMGADVHQTKDMETLLMNACKVSTFNSNYGKVIDIVKLLIEHQVDPNVKNTKRMTAFLFAAGSGNIDVVQFLRRYCDTDAVDNQGWNALFHAVSGNHYKMVKYLIRMGMDYKKHDVRRNTPLFYARRNGFHKIEELMPDDEVLQRAYETYLSETYSFKEEIANPRFMRDVSIMLYGMNSSSVIQKFQEDQTMNLLKFLTLSQDDILSMGITKPYQINRILGGLYEFHVHPFKFKSCGHESKHSILSTYDIGFSVFSIIRHYITMQATLKYLRLNVTQWDDNDRILKDIQQIEETLKRTQQLVKVLKKRSVCWEKQNHPVDLITYPNKNKTKKIYYFLPIATAISIVFFFKFHL